MKHCQNCGTKMYGGRCSNCHEETIILEQYYEEGLKLPPQGGPFMQKVEEQKRELKKLKQRES